MCRTLTLKRTLPKLLIFQRILAECFDAELVEPSVVFVDSAHVKARANSHKYHDEAAKEQAQWYGKELAEKIGKDRAAHGKKPLKDLETAEDNEHDPEPPKSGQAGKPNPNTSTKKQARKKKEKHVKVSNSDPESGWFRKGERKNVFAHSIQTACDENGVILGYSVHPGNENDGRPFPAVMEKLKDLPIELVVADSAYKTPAIVRYLNQKGIQLLMQQTAL